jgi:hypothetical protein
MFEYLLSFGETVYFGPLRHSLVFALATWEYELFCIEAIRSTEVKSLLPATAGLKIKGENIL